MKATLQTKALSDALKRVMPVLGKTTIPVLSNVLIEAQGSTLKLTGTNSDQWISVSVEAQVSQPGATTSPVRRFHQAVSLLDTKEVEISTDEKENLTLIGGSRKAKLAGIAASEFPPMLQIEKGVALFCEAEKLAEWLRLLQPFQSSDVGRLMLWGIHCLSTKEGLMLQATDGRALLQIETTIPCEKLECILPTPAVTSIIAATADGEISISVGENSAIFSGDGWTVASKLLNLSYPNVDAAIPDPASLKDGFTVNREELMAALGYAGAFSTDKMPRVVLTAANGTLKVTGETVAVADSEVRLEAKGKTQVCIQPQYLIDGLKAFNAPEVEILGGDSGTSALYIRLGGVTSITMPMRIQ